MNGNFTPSDSFEPAGSKPLEIPVNKYLVLRQLTEADSEAHFALIDRNRPHLSQHDDDTAEKYPDLDSVRRRNAQQNPGEYRFGLWFGDTLIGFAKLTEDEEAPGTTEIGYWLGEEYQGRGHMTDAVEVLTRYAEESLGYGEVVALVEKTNHKSRNLLIRIGYIAVGQEVKKKGDKSYTYDVLSTHDPLDSEDEIDFEDDEEMREWLEKMSRIRGHYPTDSNPKIAAEVREYLVEEGLGWKLHLNFDAEDPEVVYQINKYLYGLMSSSKITNYKIGSGGGKAHGQPGKEATVYIGPKDKAHEIAQEIEEGLADVLLPPEGSTLTDDTQLTGDVMARFYIAKWDRDFYGYGPNGSAMLIKDAIDEKLISIGNHHDHFVWDRSKQPSPQAMERAEKLLRERYGDFYTGTAS